MMLLREMNSPSDSIEGVNQLIEAESNRDRSIAEALKRTSRYHSYTKNNNLSTSNATTLKK